MQSIPCLTASACHTWWHRVTQGRGGAIPGSRGSRKAGAIPGGRGLCRAGIGSYLVAQGLAGQGWGHTWWQGFVQGRGGARVNLSAVVIRLLHNKLAKVPQKSSFLCSCTPRCKRLCGVPCHCNT